MLDMQGLGGMPSGLQLSPCKEPVEQIQPGCLLAIGENQPTHRDLVNWLHQLIIGVICKVYMIFSFSMIYIYNK